MRVGGFVGDWKAFTALVVLTGLVVLTLGCPGEDFPNRLEATLVEVNEVRTSDSDPQEQREDLRALGFSETDINALLSAERTGNQFGGNLTSAFADVSEGRFQMLTPDEIQIYGDAAGDVDGGPNFTLSDAEAQAILELFVSGDIDDADALSAFLADPANEIPESIPDDVLEELFVDFDPSGVVDQLP